MPLTPPASLLFATVVEAQATSFARLMPLWKPVNSLPVIVALATVAGSAVPRNKPWPFVVMPARVSVAMLSVTEILLYAPCFRFTIMARGLVAMPLSVNVLRVMVALFTRSM